MARKATSVTVMQFIQSLEKAVRNGEIKAETQLFIAGDEEGNTIGTIGEDSFGKDGNRLIIYPERSIFLDDF